METENTLDAGQITLSNGYTLYWKRNEVGGRTYFSDEIGGVHVWDTSLVQSNTLIKAIVQEHSLRVQEYKNMIKEMEDKKEK